MLVKPFQLTVIPAIDEVLAQPASLVCVPPPPVEPEFPLPPPEPDGEPDGNVIYLYVPDNLVGPIIIETRTPSVAPAPANYVCSTGIFFEVDPVMGPQPVYETRCYYDYPWLDD